ncbi:UNVERIFIED_CONTAM: Transposon TX1 uncharacterized protein [Sesamum latifolium]|uniref:Transposon TX1 uncharacterized protein n=1 Tax=Sesamum latifolium TaxID=2727402 RepID=A0AAW2W187_9LAMI
MSLGHSASSCPTSQYSTKKPMNVFVQKVRTVDATVHEETSVFPMGAEQGHTTSFPPTECTIERSNTNTPTGMDLAVYNPFDALAIDDDYVASSPKGPKTCSPHEVVFVTVVYGDNEVVPRRELWHELSLLASSIVDDPWLVLGDFNAVMDMSEICGNSGDIRVAMEDFCACILDTGLISLPMQGCSFTWHNCSEGHRAYGSALIASGLFRFDNFLARSPEFIPAVQNIWRHHIVGTSMYAVTRKLKALKPVFRAQRKRKGDLALNVKIAAEFLTIAQTILHTDRHNSLFLCLESCCRLIFLKAAKLAQCMLQQRAKMQWLRAAGDTCTDQQAVINEFVGFFQQLLGGERRSRAMERYLRPWASLIITDEEARNLTAPVTRTEIKQAFFDIEEDKAPGPDGYSAGFYKAAWPVIGEEIMVAVEEFFTNGRLLKQVNATLLVLIPKVQSPVTVADFRPISCYNVLYKAITKILVQRFRPLVSRLISPTQNAFIPGRLISDNILLAQELFAGYNQQRSPPRCAMKADLRKAYDIVEWDFLLATLQLFGFPISFIRWIDECVTTCSFLVCLNGNIHGFFGGARGLRQGDPMSPYLFVLVIEDADFTFHWKCRDIGLLHLSFVDDLLLFSSADESSVGLFQRGLQIFAGLSGFVLTRRRAN